MKVSLPLLCSTYTLFLSLSAAFQTHGRRHASNFNYLRAISAQSVALLPPVSPMIPDASPFSNKYPKTVELRSDSLTTIRDRRVLSILKGLENAEKNISAWLVTLDSDGKWPDSEVDYTTGCEARRANWPAQAHWLRIVTMAAAWHGGLQGTEQYKQDGTLRAAISLAMDYWFKRDFPGTSCLASGGKPECPCENPNNYLWNTNWFSNVILIPKLVGQASLLLGNTLLSAQVQSFVRMASRSYEYNVDGLTGANTLDVSRIGMDQALLTTDPDLLADAFRRSHQELAIMNTVRADGIRADGSFGQHDGILYNGNYGKDYANAILGIEIEAAGTEFAANPTSQAAFGTQFDGNRWMIIRNSITGILHWDFSALGRFISFPVADDQATGSIKIDLATVGELGRQWQSQPLIDFESSLSTPTGHANAGNLVGNRMFYTNDYMVHRGQNYVSTLKLWSSRTRHTECTNSQNPLGFHLADGVSYTHIRGDEYEDIAAAWDWDRIPGITTDYGATPLTCENTKLLGIESFVGGASDGQVGLAAMRYTNPVTKSLRWQKVWFFLENDVQHVIISGLSSMSDKPVISVLDQRRHNGPIIVDGSESGTSAYPSAKSMWHGGVGYKFSDLGTSLAIEVGQKTGDWLKIGISEQPPVTVDLFSAWIQHQGSEFPTASYSVFPGTSPDTFVAKSVQLKLRTLQDDTHISAVLDEEHETLMAVFWDAAGGSISFGLVPAQPITIAVDGNAAVIYKLKSGVMTLSDPSQSLSNITATLKKGDNTQTLPFALPSGGLAGSSVTQQT